MMSPGVGRLSAFPLYMSLIARDTLATSSGMP